MNVSDRLSSFVCDDALTRAGGQFDFHRNLANDLNELDDSDEEIGDSAWAVERGRSQSQSESLSSLPRASASSPQEAADDIIVSHDEMQSTCSEAPCQETGATGGEAVAAEPAHEALRHPWHEAMERLKTINWPKKGLSHFGAFIDTSEGEAKATLDKVREALKGLELGVDGPPYSIDQVARYHIVLRLLGPYNRALMPLFESGLDEAEKSGDRQAQARAKARRKRHKGVFKLLYQFKHKAFGSPHWYDQPNPLPLFAKEMPNRYQGGLKAAFSGLEWAHEPILKEIACRMLMDPGSSYPQIAQAGEHWAPDQDRTLAQASREVADEFARFRHFVGLMPAGFRDSRTRRALTRNPPAPALDASVAGTSSASAARGEAQRAWSEDPVASHNALRQDAQAILDTLPFDDAVFSLHWGWPRADRRAISALLKHHSDVLCEALIRYEAPAFLLKDMARDHLFGLFLLEAATTFFEVMETTSAALDNHLDMDWESSTKEERTRILDDLSWAHTSPNAADNPDAWRAAQCDAAVFAYKKGMRAAFDVLAIDDDEFITRVAYQTLKRYQPSHDVAYYQHNRFAIPQWQQDLDLKQRRKRQMKIVEQFLAFQITMEGLCIGQALGKMSREESAQADAMRAAAKDQQSGSSKATWDRRAYYTDQVKNLAWGLAPAIRAATKIKPRWTDARQLVRYYETKNTVVDERRQWTARHFLDPDTGRATIVGSRQTAPWQSDLSSANHVTEQFAGMWVGGGSPLDEAYRQPDTYSAQHSRLFRNGLEDQKAVTFIGNFGDRQPDDRRMAKTGAGRHTDLTRSFFEAGGGLPLVSGTFGTDGNWTSHPIASMPAQAAADIYQRTAARNWEGTPKAIGFRE